MVLLLILILNICCQNRVPAPGKEPQLNPGEFDDRNNVEKPGDSIQNNMENDTDSLDDMINAMNLEEKIGQLFIVGIDGTKIDPETKSFLEEYPFGGVILFQRNIQSPEQLKEFTGRLQKLSYNNLPLFIAVDEEGGRVTRTPGEKFPSAQKMSQMEVDEVYEIGKRMGAKLDDLGINLNFAPVLDINLDPRNEVIGERSFGSEPDKVAKYGLALSRGLEDKGIISAAKHFPGHGSTIVDSHYDLPVLDKSREELLSFETIPFREAVKYQIPAVMTAHIRVNEMDQKPATMSREVLNLLREDLSFEGVIISDDLGMEALTKYYVWEEIVLDSFLAGVDIMLICHNQDSQAAAFNILLEAYQEGIISEDRLNQSLRRILNLKITFLNNNFKI